MSESKKINSGPTSAGCEAAGWNTVGCGTAGGGAARPGALHRLGRGQGRWRALWVVLGGGVLAALVSLGQSPSSPSDGQPLGVATEDKAIVQNSGDSGGGTGSRVLLTSPTDPRPADYDPWRTNEPGEFRGYNQRASLLQRGKGVYTKYCVGCHGEQGDGNGPAAKRLITKPRDFTKGIFKFRSTDSGSLPLDSDLHRTITAGLSRVSMPLFPLMPEYEKVAVVEYIKSFYPDWEKEQGARKVVPVPAAPGDLHSPERVFRGRIVYLSMQCGKCHGSDGAGTGATQTEYTDAWGNPQRPLNFTRGRLKGGDNPEDVYRTFHTGLRSVMPAYGGATLAAVNLETYESQKMYLNEGEEEQLQPYLEQFPKTAGQVFTEMDAGQRQELVERNSWDLVAYVLSLRKEISTAAAVLGVKEPARAGNEPDGHNP